jgi:cyclophilin family peptidyl-prolyl cis-trans isomerase
VRRALLAAAIDRARTWPKQLPSEAADRAKKWGRLVYTACTQQSDDASALVRGEALRGVVLLGESTMRWLPEKLRGESRPLERVLYVRALGAATFEETGATLIEAARDRNAYVASEALTALAAMAPAASADDEKTNGARAQLAKLARETAGSRDLAVAGSALDLLKAVGSKDDLPVVAAAFAKLDGAQNAEARATAVHCGAALAGKDAVALLRSARADESPAVVAAAKEEWRKLGLAEEPDPAGSRTKGDPGAPPSSFAIEPGADYLSRAPNPKVVLHFAKGDVVLELLREQAPHHVKMMLARVADGRCDGLPIHRVVSGFVVQGLDPRGDGWGSGGVFLRDEINRVPFERGAVGMPNAGPDSGGCQIFVTLEPTPHLDGRYTVFGRIVSGMDVVDRLDLGDPCVRAEVLR